MDSKKLVSIVGVEDAKYLAPKFGIPDSEIFEQEINLEGAYERIVPALRQYLKVELEFRFAFLVDKREKHMIQYKKINPFSQRSKFFQETIFPIEKYLEHLMAHRAYQPSITITPADVLAIKEGGVRKFAGIHFVRFYPPMPC